MPTLNFKSLMKMQDGLLPSIFGVTIARVANIIFGLLIFSAIARLLGPGQFGVFTLQFSICVFLMLISQVGLGKVTMAAGATTLSSYKFYSLFLKIRFQVFLCGTSAALLGLILFMVFRPPTVTEQPSITYVCMFLFVVASAYQQIVGESLRMFDKYFYAGMSKGASVYFLFLVTVVILYCLPSYFELTLEIIWLVLATAAISSAGFYTVLSKYEAHRYKFDAENSHSAMDISFKGVSSLGLSFAFSTWLMFLTNQSDIWIASYFFDAESVGIYASGARLAIYSTIFLAMINNALLPKFSKAYDPKNPQALTNQLRLASTIGFFSGCLFLCIIFVFSEKILTLIYGADFASGSRFLRILLIGYFISIAVGSAGYGLVIMKKTSQLILSSIIGLTVTVLSLLILSIVDGFTLIDVAMAYALGTSAYQLMLLACLLRYGQNSLPSASMFGALIQRLK